MSNVKEVARETIVEVTLIPVTCHKCSGVYGLSSRFDREKHEKGGSWHCPYCDVSTVYRTSENERLKQELAKTIHRAEQREAALRDEAKYANELAVRAEHARRGEKAAKTRIKNRIAKGICPCCNRGFGNLGQHMREKHPEFTQDEP